MLSIISRSMASCGGGASAIMVPPADDEKVAGSRDTRTTSA